MKNLVIFLTILMTAAAIQNDLPEVAAFGFVLIVILISVNIKTKNNN